MTVSRYPRTGCRLAPVALRDLLNFRVPARFLRSSGCKDAIQFADLDESAWTRFDSEVCKSLGEELIEHVRGMIPRLPNNIQNRRLPQLPEGTSLGDLCFEPRTYNCLCKMQQFGLLGDAHDLGHKTIGQLLNVTGFGAKCLLDLLTAMEAISAGKIESNSGYEGDAEIKINGQPRNDLPLPLPLSAFRNLRLPKLPEGFRLSTIPLKRLTWNCLEKHGFHERLQDLENCTVADLLALPGFGMNCLYDLLRAIDTYRSECTVLPTVVEPSSTTPVALHKENESLEDELRSLVVWASHVRNPSPTDRNLCIVMQYFGFDGGGGVTLKYIGDTYGLTRERVRQICLRVRRTIKRKTPETPLLMAFVSGTFKDRNKVPPGRRGGCPPRLPQIRTCPTNASGSSHGGLACAMLPGSVP
jgi:hypothetical protein